MSERTFKVYGFACSPKKELVISLSINDRKVFNDRIKNLPTSVNSDLIYKPFHLFSFPLDHRVIGDLKFSLSNVGTPDPFSISESEALYLRSLECNGFAVSIYDDEVYQWGLTQDSTDPDYQQTLAEIIGRRRLRPGLYSKLMNGQATDEDVHRAWQIRHEAIRNFGVRSYDFKPILKKMNNCQVDGVAVDDENNDIILDKGQTFTANWTFDPDVNEIDI